MADNMQEDTHTGSRCGLAATIRKANKFRWSRAADVPCQTPNVGRPCHKPNNKFAEYRNRKEAKRNRTRTRTRTRSRGRGEGRGSPPWPLGGGGGGGEAKRSRPEKEDKKKQAKAKSAQADRDRGSSLPPRGIRGLGMGWNPTNATLTHTWDIYPEKKKDQMRTPFRAYFFADIQLRPRLLSILCFGAFGSSPCTRPSPWRRRGPFVRPCLGRRGEAGLPSL